MSPGDADQSQAEGLDHPEDPALRDFATVPKIGWRCCVTTVEGMEAGQNTPQTHRRVVSYIDKSREYYAAHGYEQPYRWASYDTVPFESWVGRDLSGARVGVVTTTYPLPFEEPKRVYAHPSDPVPDAMFTRDLSWDKDATHTDDVGTFLPLAALNRLAEDGVIGSVAPRFYGVPTDYSQRRTHADAEQIVAWAKQDAVDIMVLVPL